VPWEIAIGLSMTRNRKKNHYVACAPNELTFVTSANFTMVGVTSVSTSVARGRSDQAVSFSVRSSVSAADASSKSKLVCS